MRHVARLLWRNAEGAVAPTVALSLTALIAAGGIAFDYSRMATMDTELQGAADQAALAAAGQLDGEDGACARAANAARSMLVNRTYMANDRPGDTQVTVPLETGCDASGQVRFYKDIAKTQPATADADAKFVEIEVDPREAYFALTPIVAAFSSGQLKAVAFAGVNSAICKVPPVMLCNPEEASDPDFTIGNYIGKGIRLIANDGGGTYGPGNFGFLETNAGAGASTLGKELGQTVPPGDCIDSDTVTTDPGNMISVRDALNTRFGIYTSVNSACGNNGALCPPSNNIRQDLLLNGSGNTYQKLGFVQNSGPQDGWEEAPQPYPGSANITAAGTNYHDLIDGEIAALAPMGYPEDECHAFKSDGTGACAGGLIGDGNWDRYAYFKSNSAAYPTVTTPAALNTFLTNTFGTTTPTRYQVYLWEMTNSGSRLLPQTSGSLAAHSNPSDLAGEPAGLSPGGTIVDRRQLTAAVINCTSQSIHGKQTDVIVRKWIDLFLVQPSVVRKIGTRTSNSDVYVEVIRKTDNATNGAVQLVKKSVPYLIE